MSYTPPAGNAADFDWQGEAAYTAPGGASADFDFVTGNIVTGFTSTSIGSPAASAQFTGEATGFTSAAFGTPGIVAAQGQTGVASGIATTEIGGPTSIAGGPAQIGTASSIPVPSTPITFFTDDFSAGNLSVAYRPMGYSLDAGRLWTVLSGSAYVDAGEAQFGSPMTIRGALPNTSDTSTNWTAQFSLRHGQGPTPPMVDMYLYGVGSSGGSTWEIRTLLVFGSSSASYRYTVRDIVAGTTILDSGTVSAPSMLLTAGGAGRAIAVSGTSEGVICHVDGSPLFSFSYPALTRDRFPAPEDVLLEIGNLFVGQMSLVVEGHPAPSVLFGSPNVSVTAVASPVIPDVQFGEARTGNFANGIYATAFGTPQARIPTLATSMASTATFGVPTLSIVGAASPVRPGTRIPQAYFAFNQTQYAAGSVVTEYGGSHYAMPTTPIVVHQITAATGSKSTAFGAPALFGADATITSGFASIAMGSPVVWAQAYADAQALAPTVAFGTGYTTLTGKATGWKSTTVGVPFGAVAREASALLPAKRFGTAKALQPGSYRTHGFAPVRYGRHNSTNLFGHPAASWVAAVLGTPLGYSTLKARPSGPAAKVGRPTLRRTPLC